MNEAVWLARRFLAAGKSKAENKRSLNLRWKFNLLFFAFLNLI